MICTESSGPWQIFKLGMLLSVVMGIWDVSKWAILHASKLSILVSIFCHQQCNGSVTRAKDLLPKAPATLTRKDGFQGSQHTSVISPFGDSNEEWTVVVGRRGIWIVLVCAHAPICLSQNLGSREKRLIPALKNQS